MRICARCGLNAPEGSPTCGGCGGDLLTAVREVPEAQGICYAQLRSTFTCRVCGFDAPLDFPDADGAVLCGNCRVEQAFDPEVFRELFEEAHSTVDLAGEEQPHRRPKKAQAMATWKQQGSSTRNNVRVRIGAGRPLCDCGGVLEARRTEPRGITCSCGSCGASIPYDLPPELRRRSRALLGVIAPALRADRPRAVVSEASALLCPSCGAGLPVQEGALLATCSFCKTTALLPARSATGQRPPEAWWALFEGPSPERQRREEEERSRQEERQKQATADRQEREAQQEKLKLVAASKRNAVVFYAMAMPALVAFSVPMLRTRHGEGLPVWYSGPFFVVGSLLFFGVALGGSAFGVPYGKGSTWDPPPLSQQRVALAITAAVLVASVVVLVVVGPAAQGRR